MTLLTKKRPGLALAMFMLTALFAAPLNGQSPCDDGDPCTVDIINSNGDCLHFPKICDDGDPTTVDYCDANGDCQYDPIVCDDGDPCTEDIIDIDGNCLHFPVICDDGDPTTVDYCDSNGDCQHDLIDCDDGDPATIDYLDANGVCNHVREVCCDDGDPCTVDTIDPNTGECVHTPVDCDDGDPCTIDSCDPNTGECIHTPIDCDDGDPCTIDSCDPNTGECIHTPIDCDDGDPCTIDSCDPNTGECIHTPIDCDDGDPCTIDYCDPATGDCVHDPDPACQDRCSFSQGFWGNAGGSFEGQTTTQILEDILSDGPVVVGVPGERSLTITLDNLDCIYELLPGGGPPMVLPPNTGDLTPLAPDCEISPIPTQNNSGRIKNIFLAQALTLALNVRYSNALGDVLLEDACLTIPASLWDGLPDNPTVNDLLEYANWVLAGVSSGRPSIINNAVSDVNQAFKECRDPCVNGNGNSIDRQGSLLPGQTNPAEGLQLFPNPARHEILAIAPGYEGQRGELVILNSLGQTVYQQNFEALPSGPIRLQLDNFDNGLYFARLKVSGEKNLSKEFVVNKN